MNTVKVDINKLNYAEEALNAAYVCLWLVCVEIASGANYGRRQDLQSIVRLVKEKILFGKDRVETPEQIQSIIVKIAISSPRDEVMELQIPRERQVRALAFFNVLFPWAQRQRGLLEKVPEIITKAFTFKLER